jgi:hypothetical protein
VNLKDITWKHVAVIAVVFGAVSVLGATGRDTSALIVVGIGVLSVLGLIARDTAATKTQTNGNQSELMRQMSQMRQEQVAMNTYTMHVLAALPAGAVPPPPPELMTIAVTPPAPPSAP